MSGYFAGTVVAIDIQGHTEQVYLGIAANMDGVIYFSAVLASSLHSIKSILVAPKYPHKRRGYKSSSG